MSPSMTSVIITTYNDDHRMEATLRGFLRCSSIAPFEVIIVNDGGREITEGMIKNVLRNVRRTDALKGVQYHYLGPPTSDFRLAKARNLGLVHAQGEQVAICDCDTVPDGSFIRIHQDLYEPDLVVVGTRRRVNVHVVESVLPTEMTNTWLVQNFYAEDDRLKDPDLKRRYLGIGMIPNPWSVCWGCNFSFPRDRVLALGGFDEEFVGWGGEDEDLAARLYKTKTRFRSAAQCIVYHLDHPRRTNVVASQTLYRKMNTDPVRNSGPIQTLPPKYLEVS